MLSPLAATTVAGLLERATGQELAPARRWRIEALLGPVLRARGLESLDHLAAALRAPAAATASPLAAAVVEALLNHETFFFRDAAAFTTLVREALPALAAARAETRRLRIWSAGCATGQEAWSLALALAREPARWAGWQVEILGTDVSAAAIARAREGRYTQFEVGRGLPVRDLLAFFEPVGEEWRVAAAVRDGIAFRTHNLLDPPPSGRFDLILCRNVLLYFTPARQRAVLAMLAQALATDGLLMLGAGETVLGRDDRFAAAAPLRGLYRVRAAEDAR